MNGLLCLVRGLALAALGTAAHAVTVPLTLDVWSPDGVITPNDGITLRAFTSDEVFPDGAHEIWSSFAIEGERIDWTLGSRLTDDVAIQVLLPFGHRADLGPLPAGTYYVSATWAHEFAPSPFPDLPDFFFPQSGSLIGGVTGGFGRIAFTVGEPLMGDSNLDGTVDLADLEVLGENFGRSPASFEQGDFNGDDRVDLLDLDLLGSHFGKPAAAVPEPAAAIALVVAITCIQATARSRRV